MSLAAVELVHVDCRPESLASIMLRLYINGMRLTGVVVLAVQAEGIEVERRVHGDAWCRGGRTGGTEDEKSGRCKCSCEHGELYPVVRGQARWKGNRERGGGG
jgi:hypothetical protein